MKDAHERLVEWGEEKHYPGWDIPQPTGGALGRMLEVAHDERMKAAARRRDRRFKKALKRLGISVKKKRGSRALQVLPCKESRVGRMDILTHAGESFPFAPDGGLGDMIDRMAGSVERSRRCREVGELVDVMPDPMREVVFATYGNCATPAEVPRSGEGAASMMGISESTYWRRKAAMLAWLSERLGLRSAAAA